jgi:hypothetical protein
MTQLPATYLEAQTLAFARDWIKRACEPQGCFGPDAMEVYGKSFMMAYAQSTFGADDIVYFAENGCEQADLVLRELIAGYNDRDEPLGAVLRAYNIRLINPMRKPKQSGPAKANNFLRDMGITMLVIHLRDEFNLRPSQRTNRKTKVHPPSACSIAATALTEAGINIPLGSKGVEKVWRHYLAALAGTKWAAGTRFAAGLPPGYSYSLFGKTVLRVPSLT